MTRNILKYLALALGFQILSACTPDEYTHRDTNRTDINTVRSIKLRTNHQLLLANGKAQLEFQPVLYTDEGFEILSSRIDESWLEYYTLSGTRLSRLYSTSESSLIGENIEVYAKLKDRDIVSDTVSFQIIDPTPAAAVSEISIPVVFHLIQTKKEISSFGMEIPAERIARILEKMNNTFSGASSTNPVGVDTKIRFKPAIYDYLGRKMREPGINRIQVDTVKDKEGDQYNTFITEQGALWPYEHYMNIWLISDYQYTDFCYDVTYNCVPHYLTPEAEAGNVPEGLELAAAEEAWVALPYEAGVIYKLQNLNKMSWSFIANDRYSGATPDIELNYYIGAYLGLLPTWAPDIDRSMPDYCDDTIDYYGEDENGYRKNITWYKQVGSCFFLAENIMDDPTGVHRSVSKQQNERMRWILENCPERSAWKSDFAFTGN